MLRDAMEETGLFTVELACNGHEVLERIHAHEPELLVLDPALPGTDGIRVLRQLRREGCASEIFLISAFVSDHMLAEATELRVDYFLPKPFAFEALFDRMRGAAAQSARSALHPPSLLVTSILHELGMSPGLKGYGYIHDAALLALDDPSLLHAVTKVIYPCVARRNGTTAFCVERAIRHAIEITWGARQPRRLGSVFRSPVRRRRKARQRDVPCRACGSSEIRKAGLSAMRSALFFKFRGDVRQQVADM